MRKYIIVVLFVIIYLYSKNVNGITAGYCHLPPPTVRNVYWIDGGLTACFLCPVATVGL
jgi:hypothetical protein